MKVIIRVETIADWGETDVVKIYQFERPIRDLSPETVGLSLADGKDLLHKLQQVVDHSSPRTVLVQACQHVWLVQTHDVYRKFTYVGRTHSSLAPLRLRAGRFRLASRLGVPDIRRLRCPQSFTSSCCRLRMSE
jgi:hypothetical protein